MVTVQRDLQIKVCGPSMEADHPKWRAYVEQKAKEFYENPENQ